MAPAPGPDGRISYTLAKAAAKLGSMEQGPWGRVVTNAAAFFEK